MSGKIFGKKILLFLCLLAGSYTIPAVYASGMYGVYGNPPELEQYAIAKVWGPAQKDWVNTQLEQRRKAFFTLNAFGGSSAWKQFPDAIPVLANGEKLQSKYGGICPSHKGWRQHQLNILKKWLADFTGDQQISGIWLDFIRYPGRWEEANPVIPKTCYCKRCLTLFQQTAQVTIPPSLQSTEQKAEWIDTHAAKKWLQWKKGLILSFVKEVRKTIDEYQITHQAESEKIKLGVFLVPWRKSDFHGAVSLLLAQDAEQMAPYVDVFSPMVYHRMAHQQPSWVGEICRYFHNMGERRNIQTWPIIQSEDVTPQEFAATLREVEESDAEDVIVYSLRDMKASLWPALQTFSPHINLLPALPGKAAELSLPLPTCTPGDNYLFSADFLRNDRQNPDAYPEIALWGEEYLLNTHRTVGRFQPIKTVVTCPETVPENPSFFFFPSRHKDTPLFIRNPQLKYWKEKQSTKEITTDTPHHFFPIGVYGANAKNLSQIKQLGLNTAVVALNGDTLEKCIELSMRCTFSVPHEPDQLQMAIKKYEELLKRKNFLFYVNDEPALRSAAEWKSEDIQRILKQNFPKSPTMMAVLRAQSVPFYAKSADYFMMDQYPVPSMPMTWLSDSLEKTAGYVGRHRLMSVIQAFGGEEYAAYGWPRLPNFKEMYNLAILSVIHGSRGIYFYTFPAISATEQGRSDFRKVIQRLNSLRPWFGSKSIGTPSVRMLSPYGTDTLGNSAVHCIIKERLATKMLLCANVLPYHVRAGIMLEESQNFTDYFTGQEFSTRQKKIKRKINMLDLNFSELEVKMLFEKK